MDQLLLTLLTPALAFGGSVFGLWLARRGDRELDRWRKREETMRLTRWAVELAVSDHPPTMMAGFAALDGLTKSPMLDPDDVDFVAQINLAMNTLKEDLDD